MYLNFANVPQRRVHLFRVYRLDNVEDAKVGPRRRKAIRGPYVIANSNIEQESCSPDFDAVKQKKAETV